MADYKIIADSSCELPEQYLNDERFDLVPFRLEIDGVPIRDTKGINTKWLLEKIVSSKTFTSSACPSPDVFYNSIARAEAKHIYLITVSSAISGCYLSAMIAKKFYEDAHDDKQIFVIDSKSVSGAESQLAMLACDLEEQQLEWEEIKKRLIQSRDNMHTFMMFDCFSAVCKNIKFPKLKEVVSKAGNIKSIFVGDKGARFSAELTCIKESWNQLVDNIASTVKGATEQTRIVITHCNNLIGAEKLRDMLMEKTGIKNFVIMSMSGLSSIFTDDGGIIVSVM